MGLFEQLTNPIPTYCLEKFTEEDLIRCIYELLNYKKMNESVTVPEAYTLNDNDVAEILQNMNSDVQAQEVEEEITEETTEEAPMNVEEILQQVQQQADIISAAASSAAPLKSSIWIFAFPLAP